MRAIFTKEQLEECIEAGMSTGEIARMYSAAPCTVQRGYKRFQLCNANKQDHPRTRSKNFSTRFFETLDTEEKAYTLGFIAADGGRDRNWGIKISIHPKDRDILAKIAKAMQCDYGYDWVENNTRVKLAMYDVDMVKDLERYGICERKTKTLPFAKNVPDEFLRHYMRGVFDGDGSLGRQARLVTGSECFFNGFISWYAARYGKEPWTQREGNKYRLVFNRRDRDFIVWMYSTSSIVLDRKYKLYLNNWHKL
jgi:hypothetical protein